jgi:hypothetical protein
MTLCGRGFSRRCFKEASTSALHNQAFRQIASRFLLTCSYEAMSLSQWVSIIYGLTLLPPLPPFFVTHIHTAAFQQSSYMYTYSASAHLGLSSHGLINGGLGCADPKLNIGGLFLMEDSL